VFVTGSTGTGRTTAIKQLLHSLAQQPASLTDKCYVHNFKDPDAPMMITLAAGQGAAFKKDMAAFLAELMKAIPPCLTAAATRNNASRPLTTSRTASAHSAGVRKARQGKGI